jgi:hypothetical protein
MHPVHISGYPARGLIQYQLIDLADLDPAEKVWFEDLLMISIATIQG